MRTKQTERRIKLRLDFDKRGRIEDSLKPVVEVANEKVIPLMKELNFDVSSVEKILRYTSNSDLLKNDYVVRELELSGVENDYLQGIVGREVGAKFEELFLVYPYDDKETEYSELLKMDKSGNLFFEQHDVIETATIYIEGAELEAYDRHQEAVKAMNKFFNGKAPASLNNYFISDNGVIRAGTLVSYTYYK